MKKYTAILIILILICSVAFAAVRFTITVPDAYTVQVLNAMKTLSGTHMALEARGSSPNPEDDFDGRMDFRIEPKGANETDLQFAQRFTRSLLVVSVKVVKQHEEQERYREEISKIAHPNVNVPDEVIQ